MAKISKKQQAANRELWFQALESGKYKQGTGTLHRKKKVHEYFCCLGVACDLAVKNGVKLKTNTSEDCITYGDEVSFLPKVVQNWLGLPSNDGTFKLDDPVEGRKIVSLVELNDSAKYSFRKIAKTARQYEAELLAKRD